MTDLVPLTIEDPSLSAYVTFMPADGGVYIEASDPDGLVGPLIFTRADALRLHHWLGQLVDAQENEDWHVHDWLKPGSLTVKPCACGAVMPEAPF